MKFFPIDNPLSGERLSLVNPEPSAFPEKDWRRRLRYFQGRALTHTAFKAEQTWRNNHIATLGRLVSAGVITGLVVGSETVVSGAENTTELIHVSSGIANTAAGELITVTRPITVAVNDIFVYEHDIHVERRENTVEQQEVAEELPTFGELLDDGGRLTTAAVLVLQPVYVEINDQADKKDPCELDPENFAYENWQFMDACRLVLYTWPDDWIPTVPRSDQWRNLLVYSIFDKERELPSSQIHPWETLGVPIALVGFDEQWNIMFVDRHAVVRDGGKQRRSGSILPDIGNRFLWQAQFQQFNEQLAEIVAGERPSDDGNGATTEFDKDQLIKAAEIAFNRLPPMGILPKYFMEPRGGSQAFFSVNYVVEATAIATEQLDAAIRDSASLAPFDVDTPDRVQVLVPVPQIYFEPELLQVAVVAQEFDDTIRRFSDVRDEWLGRRLDVRRKASAIHYAMRAQPISYPETDPDAVDDLELNAPVETAIIEAGESWRYFKGAQEPPKSWRQEDFNDTDWLTGVSGIGYGDQRNETIVDDMEGFYVSLYLRKTFTLETLNDSTQYKLLIACNGGFVVYLNGHEILRENVIGNAFNARASALRKPVFQTFDISHFREYLVAGINVLAIRAHNYDIDHPSFTLTPRLLFKQFVTVDEADYGTTVKLADGVPELDEIYEPVYTVKPLTSLKSYLLSDKTPVRDTDIDKLDELGLEDFIDWLEASIKKTNLNIDFGYLRLRTEIYRVRQFVLGNVEATKLATSPILAEFAQGETATATKKDIADFMMKLQESAGVSIGTGGPRQPTSPTSGSVRSSASAGGSTLGAAADSRSGETKKASFTSPSTGSVVSGAFVAKSTPADIAAAKLTKETAAKLDIPTASLFTKPKVEIVDIEEQSPLIGLVPEFHNVTVGERLKEPIACNAKAGGIAVKAEMIESFLGTDINLAGIEVPGFRNSETGKEETKTFENIDSDDITNVKNGIHDVNPDDGDDESAFFNAGVRAMENSAAVLVGVEGRVQTYKNAINKCKETLTELKKNLLETNQRLKVIHNELSEARHDVTVSRALRDEEQTRVDALNARRDEIISSHVPFFLFRRPRVTDALINTPVHTLNPDISETELPVCIASDAETPEEISAMMDILRDAPLKWFTISEKILKQLNRLDELQSTVKGATKRAKSLTTKHPYLGKQTETLNNIGQSMAKALSASQQLVAAQRQLVAGFDIAVINKIGWVETATKAKEIISLSDVIDGNHGRFIASRLASQALADIARTATCLYIRFGQVLPSIRLDWSERLSQFDSAVPLRNLYSLPRWNEIDYIERREMQILADSLFQRILITESNAVQLMNDLIRICILLASHAPVNRIIAGQITEPTIVQVGTLVNIVTDLSRIRIGMDVMIQSGRKTVAKGKIEDIVAGEVKARIQQTKEKTMALEKDTKVQIAEQRTMASMAVNQEQMLGGFMKLL
ncbi:MAG: hypothetical protein L6365_05640 [Desulfobulbaceae bacterium]|nr:hypothetical protein [Pseudomonadota bacterium]MCG2746995.1 hypothetical protein [Desulfobulbaceae bacterium]